MEDIGFIILRNVTCEKTDKYWIHCYNNIRLYYPEKWIIIIDDNSNYDYISNKQLYKTLVIDSEYKKRGELLPYIYYIKNRLFNIAIIIHDSVIFNKYFNLDSLKTDTYKFLWEFDSNINHSVEGEVILLKALENDSLIDFYNNKELWVGCFGCMTIINYDFLKKIDDKYNLNKLIDVITNRDYRCAFERIIACILQKEGKKELLLDNIHNYCRWGIAYDDIYMYKHLPIIKFWNFR